MDDIIFYQPPSTSTGQPPRLPAAPTASIVSERYIASLAVRQPASQLNQRNEMWTEHMIKCRDVSNLSQQRHSPDQYCRNDPIQEKESSTATRNSLNDDINDDSPHIAEPQSDIQPKDISASGNPYDDDEGFINIDELLAAMREESISTGVEANSGGIAKADHLRLRSASSSQTLATTQASKLQVNIDSTQESTSSVNLDVVKEVEDQGFDIFADRSDKQDRSNARARSSRRQKNYSTLGSGISPDGGSCDHAQPLQLDLTAAHQQSDPTTKSLPAAYRARKSAPRHARHKHPRSSSVGLATAASTASTVVKSTNLEIRLSRASATDPSQERQPHDTDDGNTDDLSDEDYANHSDASSNAIERRRPSKRLRQSKNPSGTTYHDIERDSNCLTEFSNQDVATTPSTATPQSEDIPICGFLTLKTFGSKVIYCLSFSQELSPQLGGTSVSRSGDSEQSPLQEQATSTHVKHSKFSPEDDKLLRRLKEDEYLSWDEIAGQFPERSKGTLQVHYSTKLKHRPGTTQKAKKRWRSK